MIRTIAKKEFIVLVRDGRFRWSYGVVLLLLLGSLATGVASSIRAEREVAAAQQLDRQTWLLQGAKSPHSAAHHGMHAFKPQTPLSLIDNGITAYMGQAIWLEAHWQNLAQHRPAEDRTAVQRFGELTAAVVLQLFIPLLIILLSFSAFAGERDQGTLQSLASLGLRGRTLALGKTMGVAAALSLLLVPGALLGAVALSLTSSPAGFAPDLARMAIMAAGYLLYFGAFLGISMAVSAKARSSRVALVALFGFWITSCVILPRVLADLSERLYPGPSASELMAAIDRDMKYGINGHNPQDKRRKALEEKTLQEYGATKVEDLPLSFAGIALQAGEEYGNTIFDKHFGALWSTYERQNRVHLAGGALAPTAAIRSLSMGLSGTDWAHYQHFATAAEEHRRNIQRFLNLEMTKRAKGLDFDYRANASLWEQVEPFHYQSPDLGWVLRRQAAPLGLLAAWCALSLAAAVMAASRAAISGGRS